MSNMSKVHKLSKMSLAKSVTKTVCKHDVRKSWDCGCSIYAPCDACDFNSQCVECGDISKKHPTVDMDGKLVRIRPVGITPQLYGKGTCKDVWWCGKEIEGKTWYCHKHEAK